MGTGLAVMFLILLAVNMLYYLHKRKKTRERETVIPQGKVLLCRIFLGIKRRFSSFIYICLNASAILVSQFEFYGPR